MITILEFAELALYSYKDLITNQHYLPDFIKNTQPLYAGTFNPRSQTTDGFYEVFVDPDIQSMDSLIHPFYASFFVKVERQEAAGAVIAIRGTVPRILNNDWTDIKTWWKNVFDDHAQVNLPKMYVLQVANFYYEVNRYITEHLDLPLLKLFVTGHSLGGAIAALLTTYVKVPIRCVTFNAPGIKDVPGVRNYWHSVINFRASLDFVSAIDYPVGPTWDMEVPEKSHEASTAFQIAREHKADGWSQLDIIHDLLECKDFLESFMPQHSMTNLLASLRQRGIDGIDANSYASTEALLSGAFHKPNQLDTPFLVDKAQVA